MKSLGVAYAISKRNKAKSLAKGDVPEKKEVAPEKDEPEDTRGLFEFHMNEAMRYHDMLNKHDTSEPIESDPVEVDNDDFLAGPPKDQGRPSHFAKAILKKK